MVRVLQILNIAALMITIGINYLSNTGIFGGNTISSVSYEYQNSFTPAGYAFSIWGLIYLFLIAFSVYQFKVKDVATQVGWWFVITCIANSLWVFAWIYNYTGLSVLIMMILLFSLVRIIIRTNMELDDPGMPRVAFLWWPVSFYSGWITVALLANISAYLTKINFDNLGASPDIRSVIFIIIAVAVNLLITWKRNMREFAFVGSWALTGIAVANSNRPGLVFYAALCGAVILFVSSFSHGYKNREFVPWRKRK